MIAIDPDIARSQSVSPRAGLRPGDIGLLECHATGTPVGDATELRSTAQAFEGAQDLPIGSMKSNMGHLITAAGVAGIVKVLEAMRHGVRPPSLHADTLNPVLAETPFRVVREAEPHEAEVARVQLADRAGGVRLYQARGRRSVAAVVARRVAHHVQQGLLLGVGDAQLRHSS